MVTLTIKISTVREDLLPAVGTDTVAAMAAFSVAEVSRRAWIDETDSARVHLRG